MKRLILPVALALLASCGGTSEGPALSENDQRIAELEKIIYTDTTGHFDTQLALELAALYTHRIHNDKLTDSLSIELHFKAGELYMNSKKPNKAIKQFDTIVTKHPDSDKAGTAAFMKGFVAETVAMDVELAKKHYEEFIKNFPDHHLVDDAQFSISNLGLTDDELLERIRNKNPE